MIVQVEKIFPDLAESLCRKITADLPEYFGLPEANEQYVRGIHSRDNFAAKINNDYVGLISIDFPYPNNGNIYWLGVLQDFQKQNIGRNLIETACKFAKQKGATTVTVETLAPFESDENYLNTYHFYESNHFSPLLNLKPQGYEWTMVYMMRMLERNYHD